MTDREHHTPRPASRATTATTAAKKAAPRPPKPEGEPAVLEKIAAMPEPYRALGERLHTLVLRSAPELQPALWYGMPAYAKHGKAICFFRADKFMTFGLTDNANHALEEGAPHLLRESAWFFTALDDATEAKLAAIVRKAAS